MNQAGHPYALVGSILGVPEALHAIGEERRAGVVQVQLPAVELRQMANDVRRCHALGADGGREALAELEIGDRSESMHAFWHIMRFCALAADTPPALRAPERFATRRARETQTTWQRARARGHHRRGRRGANARCPKLRQVESTSRCSFFRDTAPQNAACTPANKRACTGCRWWSSSAAAPWVRRLRVGREPRTSRAVAYTRTSSSSTRARRPRPPRRRAAAAGSSPAPASPGGHRPPLQRRPVVTQVRICVCSRARPARVLNCSRTRRFSPAVRPDFQSGLVLTRALTGTGSS